MRRVITLFLCIFLLAVTVSAAGTVTDLQSTTQVHSDGTCQVSLTLQLQMDSGVDSLIFPIPAQARNVSLNGRSIRSPLRSGVRTVDLSDVVHGAGMYTVTINYSLPDSVIIDEDKQLILQFDLLSGFAYPVENMTFSVALPGAPEYDPVFYSTYYQESADTLMDVNIQGNTISGTITQMLQDQETLSFSLQVSESMFPQSVAKKWHIGTDDIMMLFLVALGLAYWLLTMGALPPRRTRQTSYPEGLTAGELGVCLTGQGIDFTMLVLSWARMGYLQIQQESSGRVLLHKRMEMGNERSDFEMRYFKTLFGRRQSVDGTGAHYARLCRKAAKATPGIRDYYRRSSGNPYLFRVIFTVIGLLGGVSLALSFANDTLWQVVLSILLGTFTAAASWVIQSGAHGLHLRRRMTLLIGLLCSGLWLLLGIWAGEWTVALIVVLLQWLSGLAAAYGGRRSDLGKQYMSQILGLRRYMRKVTGTDLQRTLQQNPDYYYSLAPYAMALGVDRAFARQFGSRPLPECPYLITAEDAPLTARQWNDHLRRIVAALDERQQRMPIDKLLGK